MIRFPETAETEWKIVADAAQAEERLRLRLKHDTTVENETEKLRVRHEAAKRLQDELEAGLTPALEISTLADHVANPAATPTDLIEGVVKDNGVCIVIGPANAGKSTTALQMTYSMMTGDDWLGQKSVKIDGGVGIMSYDMDAPLMFDWMSGFPKIDKSKVSIVNAYKRGNPLGVPEMRAAIVEQWKTMNVQVVMIDSFTASFFAENENDSASVQNHYRDLIKFALTEVGARALIVIAHTSDAQPLKIRGSSAHHGVADSIVAQVADQANMQRSIRMVKYRAALGQTQMNPVVISKPDSVTHLVSLDYGAMNLAGMALPPGVAAMAFTALPDPTQAPDTDSDSGSEDDDL